MSALRAVASLVAVLAVAPLAPAAEVETRAADARLEGSLTAVEAPEGEVRRWEYVVFLRTAPEAPDALGRAQIAAMKAGGAVLDDLRMEATGSHEDWRLLVRTRHPDSAEAVVRAVRATPGVLGATVAPLPETPTYPGGPSFFESYQAPDDDRPSNADRVVMRHEMPPLADKKELLEMSDVIVPPSAGPDGTGGFTLNVSEMFSRLKEGAWRRREERLRNTPIIILPPAGTTPAAP